MNKLGGSAAYGTRFYDFQVSTPSLPYPLRLHVLTIEVIPFGEYFKICFQQASRQNVHVWNSHHQHAARLFLSPDNAVRSAHPQQQPGYLLFTSTKTVT